MSAMRPRILLVEPQFVLRRTMVMVARDLGMVDFQEASSVGRARALLATDAYEGVVLDLQEGPQALELLSELRQGRFATPRDTRVVVLAGGGSQVDTERLQGLGVARVLGKPVRISDVAEVVWQAANDTSKRLRFAAGAEVVKFLIFYLARSMPLIYLGQCMQFFQFAVYAPATVYYVAAALPERDQLKGQSLIYVAGSGLGGALGNLLGGRLLDRSGIQAALLLGTVSAAASLLTFCLSTREDSR